MKLGLMVVTDGRDYFWETMKSFSGALDFSMFDERIVVDDSLSVDFTDRVREDYPEFWVYPAAEKRGFAGAIRKGWSEIGDCDYVFHLEDDFVCVKPFVLSDMISVLEENPHLLQMALLRGPVNAEELRAGGVIEQSPSDYKTVFNGRHAWREHRKFFTTNPSVYPRSTIAHGWPSGEHSEGRFGFARFSEDPGSACAFWGDSGTWVEHIGKNRAGTGY